MTSAKALSLLASLTSFFIFQTNVAAASTDASEFAVTAAGTSNGRLLEARFAELANVLDYGANGSDANDDTEAIQAAIDSGIRDVFIPAGRYWISDHDDDGRILVVGSNVHLHGAGRGVSILRRAADDNYGVTIKVTADAENVMLSHFTLDGNKANQSNSSAGIQGSEGVENFTVRSLELTEIRGWGLSTNGDGSLSDPLDSPAKYVAIHDVLVSGGFSKNIQARRSQFVTISNCHVRTEGFPDDPHSDSAIEVSRSSYVTVIGNTTDGTGSVPDSNGVATSPGFRVVNDSSFVTVNGNVAKGGRQGIIVIDASNVVISDNIVSSPGAAGIQVATTDQAGVWGGVIRNIMVHGNHVTNGQQDGFVTHVSDNGVRIDNLVISENTFYDDGANVMEYGLRAKPNGTIDARIWGNRVINAQTKVVEGVFSGGAVTTGTKLSFENSSGVPDGSISQNSYGMLKLESGVGGSIQFYNNNSVSQTFRIYGDGTVDFRKPGVVAGNPAGFYADRYLVMRVNGETVYIPYSTTVW